MSALTDSAIRMINIDSTVKATDPNQLSISMVPSIDLPAQIVSTIGRQRLKKVQMTKVVNVMA